ncbi:MAG: tetratricopeptide repeat protein [Bacteroidia bacterium]
MKRITYLMFLAFVALGFLSTGCQWMKPKSESLANDTTISLEAREWSKKIDEYPENVEYYEQRAMVFVDEERFDLAIADYEKAIELDDDDPSLHYKLGDALFADDKTTLALEEYRAAEVVNPNDVTAVFKHAQFLLFVRQFDKSKIKFGKLLNLNPEHAQGTFLSGMLYKETGDTASAISFFEKTIQLLGSDYNSSMQLAQLYQAQGNLDQAYTYYGNALSIDPLSDEAYYARGLLYHTEGKYAAALDDYQKTIDANSTHYYAYYNAGNILADQGSYIKAIDHFEICIRVKDDFAKAYNRIGQCFELLGKKEQAEENYTKCLQIDPNFALAKEGLGRLENL